MTALQLPLFVLLRAAAPHEARYSGLVGEFPTTSAARDHGLSRSRGSVLRLAGGLGAPLGRRRALIAASAMWRLALDRVRLGTRS
jgi:hypothetical protein